MPNYSLEGDRSGLPKTTRRQLAFEMDPLTMRDSWGAGTGSLTADCRLDTATSPLWVGDMVGSVGVAQQGATLQLVRNLPERFPGFASQGVDPRILYCSGVSSSGAPNAGQIPSYSYQGNFANPSSKWGETKWRKYTATFEAFPFQMKRDAELPEMTSNSGTYPGARELHRYVIRSRRTTSKEQPLPAGSTGFKDTTTGKKIGQVGFKVIEFAEVSYRWVRVPVGWPPPIGWTGFNGTIAWPPVVGLSAPDVTKRRARDAYINAVNSDWWDVAAADGYAWPPGTLLYLGYDDSNRYFDAAGQWVMDITFFFRAKMGVDVDGARGGWNYALNSQGKWVYINLEGALPTPPSTTPDTPPYKSVNFDNLFQYA